MTETCKMALTGPMDKYKSIPFWSWNNVLEEDKLVKQIEDMHAAGIGGFIMHARLGLKDEYLGEKWFSCIGACLDKARQLGMEAWVYDENGWPSGFVGGKLLENEDFRARYLEYAVGSFDNSAYAVFVADEACGYRRVEEPVPGVSEYHNVYLRISPANTDILDPRLVEAFLEETHEKYYARFADSFGKELAGFFTDEPQYYRWATPYTPWAEPYFDDIRDGLIWLFIQDRRGYPFRQKYYGVLNDLYTHNFYKRIYEWCQEHHCKLTGHSVEESTLFAQMWGGAAVMPSYEFEDMPGIDSLGRWSTYELPCRQVASVAAQLGKPYVLTETFGCSGYDVTPKELRSIAEAQYFQGINRMCQHLYPYSVAGQGRVDHPPVFGPQGNWGEAFKTYNDYFTRLGYLVGNTREVIDVAVLSPVRDVWLDYIRSEDYQSVAELEDAYGKLVHEDLRKNGIQFHIIDEKILERHGAVEGDKLRVGEMEYGKVLIPRMQSLAETTHALLSHFRGKLCMLSEPQYIDGVPAELELHPNCSFEQIMSERNVPFACPDGCCFVTCRRSELGEFLFIKNLSDEHSSVVTLDNAQEYHILDLQTLAERPAATEMTVEAWGSLILVRSDTPVTKVQAVQSVDVTDAFAVTDISDNYTVLDYAQISKDGIHFGERYPIPGLFEQLLREDYKGTVTVRQGFRLKDVMSLTLIMEKAKLLSAAVNGQAVAFRQSDMDISFCQADISALVQPGENEFCYSFDFWQHEGVRFALFDPLATESLRNCLYYDTSIEPVYLRGKFVVDKDMQLARPAALPPMTSAMAQEGYPFFKGTLTLEGSVEWDGESTVTMGLEGRFMVAQVSANGKSQELALDTKGDITQLLSKGENRVKIVLRSSLRNLFGPHHFAPDPEPMGASPYHFHMRGSWGEGISSDYTHSYSSVPFGIKSIWLKIERRV